jgi:sugar phosphate isomerase/epimerase
MSTTHTGSFKIGFRRNGKWQEDIDSLISWAKTNHFSAIDTGFNSEEDIKKIKAAGLEIGSTDLMDWGGYGALISPDKATRAAAVKKAAMNIGSSVAAGAKNFFTVMVPEKADLPRKENFGYMLESYAALVPVLEQAGGRLVVEGWPGPGALCCTPEGYRALFHELPSHVLGVNYDPSHLIRMGIDPLRFLNEVAVRVYHVHGKDTALYSEHLYEFGHEQPPTFAKMPDYGAMAWRYTIPGHGQARWVEIFRVLKKAGYNGCVSVELEDANFNGTEEGEKRGFILSRQFLAGV